MKRLGIILGMGFILVSAAALARPKVPDSQLVISEDSKPTSTATFSKSVVDTTYLLGGPDALNGSFETSGGQPDWHGWTGLDATVPPGNHWHTSSYMADALPGKGPGNNALYCGDETLEACDPPDSVGGYGPNWREEVEWRHIVADTSQSVTVRLTGLLRHDTETGYDYVHLGVNRGDVFQILASWDDLGTEVLDYSVVLNPGDFTGPSGNEIRLAWRVQSDSSFDDLDCQFSTRGACQIDDLTVEVDSVLVTFDDFESGESAHWIPNDLTGVGDFANLRNDLADRDPCFTNTTYQVNFVDDGVVVPGTGGTPCITWCYDPGGWIVNNDGGLLADFPITYRLDNRVVSPPLAWPENAVLADLAFDVYRDEPITDDSAGIVYTWYARSTSSSDPADLETAPWNNGSQFFFGGPDYKREEILIDQFLDPDVQWVQVALAVSDVVLGWGSFADGPDGSPAPYFDNVAVRAWDPWGPRITDPGTLEMPRFGDAYPEQGYLDPTDLASNSCRVDGVRWGTGNLGESRQDAIKMRIFPTRPGAVIPEPPLVHWVMECNPVFDGVRPVTPDGSNMLRGSMAATLVSTFEGPPYYQTWAFDLPDSGWFFPGDRLRYYLTASDEIDGDLRTSVFPADTTGILDFSSSDYHVYSDIGALPSVDAAADGAFPRPMKLVVDYTNAGNDLADWTDALRELGFVRGVDFDLIRPRTLAELDSPELLASYQTMLMTNGPFKSGRGISSDQFYDDATLLADWLDLGGKKLLLAGDQLVSRSYANSLFTRLGVNLENADITEVNGGARDLEVMPAVDNGILPESTVWNVPDGCPDARWTDAIGIVLPGIALAQLQPEGSSAGARPGVVATEDDVLGNRTVVLPFDLARIGSMTVGKAEQYSARASFLSHILVWLETGAVSAVGDVPGVREVAVSAHPNPFNPATTISFALPRAGSVTLEIYDVQGRKVRTLINDQRFDAGRHEQPWNGRDEGGRGTSSGVYFYRFVQGAEERVGKLTLLK